MKSENQDKGGFLKQELDRELAQAQIVASEQLLEQTKKRILSEQEKKKRYRRFRWQPLLATAAVLTFLCISLSIPLQQGQKRGNDTAEDSLTDFAMRPAAEGSSGLAENDLYSHVDGTTTESTLPWTGEMVQDSGISFDIVPEFLYSCGAEEGELYLLFVCKEEKGYENRLYRLSLSENQFYFAFCVSTETAPQNASWREGTLFLLLEGEWVEAGEWKW